MRFVRTLSYLCTSALVVCSAFSAAQTAAPKPAPPAATARRQPTSRVECSKEGEFCVAVPVRWKRLGDVFEGVGFVVAEPSAALPQEKWLNMTVAMIFLPEPAEGQELPDFDSVVTLALVSDEVEHSTLQRSRREIAGREVQTARVRVKEEDGSEAAELLGFVRVDDDEIFSLALHCPPQQEARMTPIFERALTSLKIVPQPEPATPAAPSTPAVKPPEK